MNIGIVLLAAMLFTGEYVNSAPQQQQQKKILVRVQSPQGMKRVELLPTATIRELYEAIHDAFQLDNYSFSVFAERGHTNELPTSQAKTLNDHSIKHGDIVYMRPHAEAAEAFKQAAEAAFAPQPGTSASNSTNPAYKQKKAPAPKKTVKEDQVDKILEKLDGRIQRGRDPKYCRHGENAGCRYCSPLEPWNPEYLKEHKIKHLSFHSYIQKLSSGPDKGKYLRLEDLDCSIKKGCTTHPPYPLSVCTRCQPSAITLDRQTYRHVDNVMFENTEILFRFLGYWRQTGYQRIGYLYGTYEPFNDVPLGIRARVAAIYEPPQDSSRNHTQLLEDERDDEIDAIAAKLGLTKVGWIFTDLIPDDPVLGTVKHIRGKETFTLSAQELILAGHFQNKYPNPCKHSSKGTFGSKFVTVCATGNSAKQIDMEGYAVSNQGMALIRNNILLPTNAPDLAHVKERTAEEIIPPVQYRATDEYGNNVTKQVGSLPVEFLIVDVPATAPLEPTYTFTSRDTKDMFPIENRFVEGQIQDFNALTTYIAKWTPNEFLDAVSDFHLLVYLYFMEMLPMKSAIDPLLEAVRTKNFAAAVQWKDQEVWSTLETLIAANSNSGAKQGKKRN